MPKLLLLVIVIVMIILSFFLFPISADKENLFKGLIHFIFLFLCCFILLFLPSSLIKENKSIKEYLSTIGYFQSKHINFDHILDSTEYLYTYHSKKVQQKIILVSAGNIIITFSFSIIDAMLKPSGECFTLLSAFILAIAYFSIETCWGYRVKNTIESFVKNLKLFKKYHIAKSSYSDLNQLYREYFVFHQRMIGNKGDLSRLRQEYIEFYKEKFGDLNLNSLKQNHPNSVLFEIYMEPLVRHKEDDEN